MVRTIHLARNIMNGQIDKATIPAGNLYRWCQVFWLATLLIILPIAASHAESEGEAATDAQPVSSLFAPVLSDEALERAHAKGLYMEASLVAPLPGVILWDESGSIRRTGSGASNTQTGNLTVTVNWK